MAGVTVDASAPSVRKTTLVARLLAPILAWWRGWSDGLPPRGHPDWAVLHAHMRGYLLKRIQAAGVVAAGGLLLWWPTDFFLLTGDPLARAATTRLRIGTPLVMLAMLAALRWWPLARRNAQWAALPFTFAATLWTSHCLGYVGGLETPWFYALLFILMFPTAMAASFKLRAVYLPAIFVAIVIGFFATHPQNLASKWVPDAVMFGVSMVGVCMGVGHLVYVTVLREFFATRRFELLARELDSRVAAQTAELRMLGTQAHAVREQERKRISRELHDELGQSISASRYVVAGARRSQAVRENAGMADMLNDVDRLLTEASATVRRVVEGLQPPLIAELGLIGACETLCDDVARRATFALTFDTRGDDKPSEERGLVVYRVLQEALTNVMRHARATNVVVDLIVEREGLQLTIIDNGQGIAATQGGESRGFGLLGMRERAHSVGGRVDVGDAPGGGTRIVLTIDGDARPD